MSTKGPPFSLFDILQQNEDQKVPKGPFFRFFGAMRLPLKFLNFLSKIFHKKTPRSLL